MRSIFDISEDILTENIHQTNLKRIWDDIDIDFEDGDWIEYPYVREVFCEWEENNYKLCIYGVKTCGVAIEDIDVDEVWYKNERLDYSVWKNILT